MKSKGLKIFKNILSTILIVGVFFFTFIGLVYVSFNALYIKTYVKGFSMRPTINMNIKDQSAKGDTIYINQYAPITNNDIVVAKPEWHPDHIIKRVVGTPGDKIEIKELDNCYGVFVNDSLLYTKEIYTDEGAIGFSGSVAYYENYKNFLNNPEFQKYIINDNGNKYIQLGKNDYFLMGDNWGHTTDSIEKGPLKANQIVGRVDLIVDVTDDNKLTPIYFMLKKIFCLL